MSAAAVLSLVPKRMSLYEHIRDTESIADLVDALDEANQLTPEASAELSAALIGAICGTKEKVDRCAGVLASLQAAEAAAVAERERLDKRAKYFARQADRLTEYVLAVMTASKLDQLDGETSGFRRRKNPPKLIVDDPTLVPWDFLTVPDPLPDPDPFPNNAAIKAAIKAGTDVPGCRLVNAFRLVRE